MTGSTIPFSEYLRDIGADLDTELLREAIALMTQLLMEAEVS